VPLDGYFDNDGIDTATPRDGDFDGSGYAFPGEEFPSGLIEVDGVPYLFPSSAPGVANNIVAMGQRITLPRGRYATALALMACSGGTATVHYADGTTTTAALSGADWYSSAGPLISPYRYAPGGGTDQSPVSIGAGQVWIDPARDAVALTLPVTRPAQAGESSLHVFALSPQPVVAGRALALRTGSHHKPAPGRRPADRRGHDGQRRQHLLAACRVFARGQIGMAAYASFDEGGAWRGRGLLPAPPDATGRAAPRRLSPGR
jgi:alpha-L-fucosidase